MEFSRKILLGLVFFVLLAVVGLIDYTTGFEVNLAIFYFIPISYAAWWLGTAYSLIAAALCAAVLTYAEVAGGRTFSATWIVWEHAIMRGLVFGFIAYSFVYFRKTADRDRAKIQYLEEAQLTFCTCCSKVRGRDDIWVNFAVFLREENTVSTRSKICPTCSRQAYAKGLTQDTDLQ